MNDNPLDRIVARVDRAFTCSEEERWNAVDPDALTKYFARDGRQISMREWCEMFEDDAYKRVAESNVGFYWVSTVWLGLDHSFRSNRPIIFETMVFPRTDMELRAVVGRGGLYDKYGERYATEAEALAGHARIVAALEAGTLEMNP